MIRTAAVIGILLGVCASARPTFGAEKPSPAVDQELLARIRNLVRELGDNEYETREAAGRALRRIGRPALELVKAATGNKDPERARRAKDLVSDISRLPDPIAVDPRCTNGYMLVCGPLRQFQTFTAGADARIDAVRFRAARTYAAPGKLHVALYAGDKPDEKPLASAAIEQEWTDPKGTLRGVTRFMQWFDAPAKAELKKGKTYCIAFRSPTSTGTAPWLVNCFYRDTLAAGGHRLADGKREPERLGDYDLVFQVMAEGKAVLTSVPEKLDLTKLEHFGLGHDGTDLRPHANK